MTDAAHPSGSHATAALARYATALAGASLLGIALVEAWQVFARYVMNASPGWTEPVALLLLVTAMSFGAASGVRNAAHFGFFLLLHALPPRLRRMLDAIGQLIVTAVGVLLSTASTRLLADGWSVPMAGVALPQSMPYLPLALAGALIALFALERAWLALHAAPERS